MSFISIKNKLKTVLETITDIQEVHDYPTQKFTNFPSAVVRTNGNTSDYETTSEDLEIYDFTIFLFYSFEATGDEESDIRDRLEALCDTVRDTIDSDEFLNGISLPSGRTMIGVRPTVSVIGEFDSGKYIGCEIDLAVRISKDIT